MIKSGDEEKPATCKDYMLHFITFFWKFLFAFVPPTSNQKKNYFYEKIINNKFNIYIGIAGGWLCFCVSISIIGMLTAVIGDLATHVNN
jgi:solute carrier family 8 (sodium/calcium exchanger)